MKNDEGMLWYGTGIDNTQLQKDAQKSKQLLSGIGDSAVAEGARIDNTFKSLAIVGGLSTVTTVLGKNILETTAKFEKFDIVLKNTLGDAEGAAALEMITRFAATTPFQLDEVTGSFIKMANQGFVPTWEQLTKLGDLASSTGKSFDQLTEAILDAQTGQFERLKEFGIKASSNGDKVTFSFKEQETTVDKTNSAIQKYILSLGELKGVAGANAKISESLTGQLSNLEDKIAAIYNNIGKENSGILYAAVGGVGELAENYEEVGKILLSLVAVYGTYKTALIITNALEGLIKANKTAQLYLEMNRALGALTLGHKANAVAIALEESAQNLLNKTIIKNPYALALAAVVALGIGIYALATHTSDAEKMQKKFNKTVEESDRNIASEKIQIETLFARLNAAKKGTEEYKSAKQAILDQYGNYLTGLGNEIESLNNVKGAYDAITEAAIKSARARALAKATQDAADDLSDEQGDIKEKLKKLLDKKFGKDSKKSLNYYYQLIPVIDEGKGVEGLNDEFAKMFDETHTISGITETTNKLKDLVGSAKYAKKSFDDLNEKAELKFGKVPTNTKPKVEPVYDDFNKQLETAQGNVKKLKNDLADLKAGKGNVPDFSAAIKKKTGELKTAQETLNVLLGKTSTDDKAATNVQKTAQENADIQKQITENTISEGFNQRQAVLDTQKAILETQEDGFSKQKQLNDLNYKQSLLDIDKHAQDLIKTQQAAEKLAWQKAGSKGVFKPLTTAVEQLPESSKERLRAERVSVDIIYTDNSNDIIKNLTDKYKSFDQKRKDIDKRYNDEASAIKALYQTKSNDDKSKGIKSDYTSEVDAALTEMGKRKKEEIKQINEDEAAEIVKTSDLFVELFSDASDKSIQDIKRVLNEVQTLYNYLKNTPVELITDQTIGGKTVSASDLKKVKSDPGQMKNLKGQIDSLTSSADKGDIVFGDFKGSVSKAIEGFTKGKDGLKNFKSGVEGISSAFGTLSTFASGLTGMLDALSREEGDAASSASKSIGAVMDIASSTMQGFQQGGWVGAAIAFTTSTLTKVFEAEKAHEEALKAIKEAKIATQKEYNDLLLEQNYLLENAETIFGTDAYGQALGYVQQVLTYADKARQANAALKASTVATDSEKTGLFGWGGDKTIYSGLLKMYPALINSQGRLNTELAESILNNQKLDDKSKEALQSALDYAEKYEEALSNLNSYLNSVFGDLGNSMMDSIVNNLGDTKAALDDFANDAAATLDKLFTDIAYSIYFADVFKNLSDDINRIYDDKTTSNEEKAALVTAVMSEFYSGLDDEVKGANDFIEMMRGLASKNGFELESDSSRTATAKGIATASQDSVDLNNGLLTTVSGHTYSIMADFKSLLEISNKMLEHLAGIDNNTKSIDNNTKRLEVIEKSIGEISTYVNDIMLKGVIMR